MKYVNAKIYSYILKNKVSFAVLLITSIIALIVFRKFILLEKLYLFNDIGGDTIYYVWPQLIYLSDAIRNGNFG